MAVATAIWITALTGTVSVYADSSSSPQRQPVDIRPAGLDNECPTLTPSVQAAPCPTTTPTTTTDTTTTTAPTSTTAPTTTTTTTTTSTATTTINTTSPMEPTAPATSPTEE